MTRMLLVACTIALAVGCTGPGPLGLGTKPSGVVQVFAPGSQTQPLVTTQASPMPLYGGTTFNVFEQGYNGTFGIIVVAWNNGQGQPCLVGSSPNTNQVLVSYESPNSSSGAFCIPGEVETVNFVDKYGQHGPSQYFSIGKRRH
jgi:hypothetical protein